MRSRGAYGAKGKRAVPTTFGQRVRAVRLGFGWTQLQLANMLGVLQQAVSNWEMGLAKPEGPTRQQLVGLFGVSWPALLTGEDFHVPAHPLIGLALGDGILASEGSGKNPILLPAAGEGEGWLVVIGTGERNPLSREEAIQQVNLAYDQGAALWVVVDRPRPKPPVKMRGAK